MYQVPLSMGFSRQGYWSGLPFPSPLSCILLFVTPWAIQSMEFSRPKYWSGYSFPSPGHLPNPGIEPRSPTLQVDSLPAETQGKLKYWSELPFPSPGYLPDAGIEPGSPEL